MAAKALKKGKRFDIRADRERCKACYICIQNCPKEVFEKEEGFNAKGYQPVRVARAESCIGCRSCTIVCPDVVFELYEIQEPA